MKVGILGSGDVGQTLGNGFLTEGYEVMIGTRDTSKADLVKWHQQNPAAKLGSFAETAKFGEIIVLAVAGDVAEKAITQAGKENFANKIVIDATNPIKKAPPDNGVLHFFTTLDRSLMEDLQTLLPDAKFVKAFNSVGHAFMYKPNFPDGKPTMFICGNDDRARTAVWAFSRFLVTKRKTWVRPRLPGRLNRFVCCGAFQDLFETNGRMDLSS